MKKRILSLLLSLIMVLSLLPTTAWADRWDGYEPDEGYYRAFDSFGYDSWTNNGNLTGLVSVKVGTTTLRRGYGDSTTGAAVTNGITVTLEAGYYISDYKYVCGDKYNCRTDGAGHVANGGVVRPGESASSITLNPAKKDLGHFSYRTPYWLLLQLALDNTLYHVTYDWGTLSGQLTASVPTDSNGYKVNQVVTVLAPSADATNAATGLSYVFKGWKADFNDETYQPDGKFGMPRKDVKLTAQWETVPTGSLTITKVLAGDGASAAASKVFTFTVKNAAGATVATKTITGESSTTVDNLPLGTYTVTESGAGITGYDLKTEYNGVAGTSYDVTIGGTATQSGQTSRGIIINCGCGCYSCWCSLIYCECDDKSCCDECKCSGNTDQPDQPTTPTTPIATVNVTNTYTQKKTDITVEKVWANVGGITLPNSIQVQLYNGTTKVGDAVTLNAANGWKYTFENLPEYDGSTKITYTAKEVAVPTGFQSSENGLVITNTAKRGDDIDTPTSLTITKVDKDNANKKLAGAVFTLTKNGQTVDTKTTDANGVATFTGLTEGTYTLTETKAPAGYDLDSTAKTIVVVKDSGTTALGTDNVYHTTYKHSVQDNDTIGLSNGAMTIQNTRSTTSVTVTKAWVHNNVPTAQQPTSVTVELMKNGNVKAGQATLSASNQWTHTFTNMPTHDDSGTPITYTVVEGAVSGYTGAVTGSVANGFTITNTAQWTDEKDNTATLTITKVDGEDNTELTGAEFKLTLGNKTLTSVDNNNGTYTISGIDAAGNWTLTETKAPNGYEAANATWTVAVAKSSEVKLVDVTVGETTVKKFQTENTYTITDNANIGLASNAITVTNNKLVDEPITVPATVTVTKYNDDKSETLKGAEFKLYNDKDEVVGTATTGDDGTCTFSDLTTGTYTLKETKAPTGYSLTNQTVEITVTENSTTAINASGKFQTTTTYTASPATAEFVNNKILISVNVTKEWNDTDAENYRPDSVTVQLYKNNTAVTGKTLVLTAANDWKGSFTDLPEYDGEDKNVYTVKEVDLSGSYTATEDTANNRYTITNTAKWSNEDAITGAALTIKKVDSTDDTKLLSGAKFTLTDKENLSNPVEAITDANGIASFTDLQPGTYMLEEVSAPNGYKENHQVWTVVVTKNKTHTSVNKLADGTFQKVYDCTVTVSEVKGNEYAPMTPNNDGSYTITNELAPTEYKATVEIEKIVKKTGGNVAPGKEEFVFVAYYKGAEKNMPVGEARIITNGVDTYTGTPTLTVPASAFKLDANGNGEITLYVSEVKGSSAGWTYDANVYELVMTVKNYEFAGIRSGDEIEFVPSIDSVPEGQLPSGDSDTVTLQFTNEFSQTNTPNRPHKPSKPITSVKTGDAGVAMYAMSGLLSLGGAALFMKKRKDEE